MSWGSGDDVHYLVRRWLEKRETQRKKRGGKLGRFSSFSFCI